jgi:hypothetical protein
VFVGAVAGVGSLIALIWLGGFRFGSLLTEVGSVRRAVDKLTDRMDKSDGRLAKLEAYQESRWRLSVGEWMASEIRGGKIEEVTRSAPTYANADKYIETYRDRFDPTASRVWLKIARSFRDLPADHELAQIVVRDAWPTVMERSSSLGLPPTDIIAHSIATIHELHAAIAGGRERELPYPGIHIKD